MPLPVMRDFSPSQETALTEVVLSAASALSRARRNQALNGFEFRYNFDMYFGRGTGNTDPLPPPYMVTMRTLATTLENMEREILRPRFELVLESLDGDCAQADTVTFDKEQVRAWKAEQRRLNPILSEDKAWMRAQKQAMIKGALGSMAGAPRIAIDPSFFNLSRGFSGTESRVQTFLHELSHLAAGTKDQPNGYGLGGCDRIRALGPSKAVKNAENISYYVASFVNLTPVPSKPKPLRPPVRP